MKLDVNGQHYNVASAATGNAALGFGIAGTALGLMGNNRCGNGGILGGLFGGNNCGCNDCYVTEREQNLAIALAQAQSKDIAQSFAREEDAKIFNEARRSDDKIASVLEKTNSGLVETAVGLSRLDAKVACLEKDIAYMKETAQRNFVDSKAYTDMQIAHEAQLRKAGDDAIAAWADKELAKKISGELVISGSDIRWGGCQPVLCNTSCQGTEANPLIVKQAAEAAAQAVMAAMKK